MTSPLNKGICLLSILVTSCSPHGSAVFSGPVDTWDAEARKLPLSQRYEAFRYGVTKMKPPVILDDPMADGGQSAAKFIMDKNDARPNDFMMIASMHVYDRMKARGIWSVCDSPGYDRAKMQASLIRDGTVRQRYVSYLGQVCYSRDQHRLIDHGYGARITVTRLR